MSLKKLVTQSVYLLVFIMIYCFIAYQPSTAQVTTADLEGKIVNENNEPLPNVNVIVKNQETGILRGSATAFNGRYRVPALNPGIYEITTRHISYAVEIRKDITLSVGQVLSINFQLIPEVIAATDTLVVLAETPLIETTQSDIGIVVNEIEIRHLPLNNRDITELSLLSPGVTHGDDFSFSPVFMGGNSSRGTTVFLDGLAVSSEITGGLLFLVPLPQNAVEQFEVITKRFKAEYGKTEAGIINLITKSGSNEFHGSLFGLFSDDALNERNHFATEKSQYERQQFGFTFGGPIFKNRTHFFLAFERSKQNTYGIVNTNGVLPEEEGKFLSPIVTSNYFIKLDHQLSPKQWLIANFAMYQYDFDNAWISGIWTKNTGSDMEVRWNSGSISHKWVISDRLLNEVNFGYVNFHFDLYPLCSDPCLIYPSYIAGGTPDGRQDANELNFQIRNDLSYYIPDMWGEHNIKFGFALQRIKMNIKVTRYDNGIFIFDSDTSTAPFMGVIGDGNTDYGNLFNTRIAFYIQDDWSPLENLTLNLGLRYSVATNATNQDYVSTITDPDLQYLVKADRPIDKNNFAPRLGFAWDPIQDGKTVIRGGYGVYYGQIISDVAYNEIRKDRYRVYNVFNPGTTIKEEINLEGLPHQLDGFLPEKVSNPYTKQFSIGFSRQLFGDFALDIDYIGSRGFNYIFAKNDINPIDPATFTRPMAQYDEVFLARTDGRFFYEALQVALRKRFSHRYLFRASYTLSKAENDFDDIIFSPSGSFLRGSARWDERHRFQFNYHVLMPFGVQLSGIVTLVSGRPYSVNTGNDDNLNGNFTDDYLPGKGRNSERAKSYSNVALRLSKVIHIGKFDVELISEAFNLLNHVNYDAMSYVGNANSPNFGEPSIALAPRRIQFGARISF